jgi:hypothetical protein
LAVLFLRFSVVLFGKHNGFVDDYRQFPLYFARVAQKSLTDFGAEGDVF